jgi:hypothetical protein
VNEFLADKEGKEMFKEACTVFKIYLDLVVAEFCKSADHIEDKTKTKRIS